MTKAVENGAFQRAGERDALAADPAPCEPIGDHGSQRVKGLAVLLICWA